MPPVSMSMKEPVVAGTSFGYMEYQVIQTPVSNASVQPLTLKKKGNIMATLGAFIMTWQQVILCMSFVAGGVVLGLKDKETLAAMILGAAAGYLAQPFLKNGSVKKDSEDK